MRVDRPEPASAGRGQTMAQRGAMRLVAPARQGSAAAVAAAGADPYPMAAMAATRAWVEGGALAPGVGSSISTPPDPSLEQTKVEER